MNSISIKKKGIEGNLDKASEWYEQRREKDEEEPDMFGRG